MTVFTLLAVTVAERLCSKKRKSSVTLGAGQELHPHIAGRKMDLQMEMLLMV